MVGAAGDVVYYRSLSGSFVSVLSRNTVFSILSFVHTFRASIFCCVAVSDGGVLTAFSPVPSESSSFRLLARFEDVEVAVDGVETCPIQRHSGQTPLMTAASLGPTTSAADAYPVLE